VFRGEMFVLSLVVVGLVITAIVSAFKMIPSSPKEAKVSPPMLDIRMLGEKEMGRIDVVIFETVNCQYMALDYPHSTALVKCHECVCIE